MASAQLNVNHIVTFYPSIQKPVTAVALPLLHPRATNANGTSHMDLYGHAHANFTPLSYL